MNTNRVSARRRLAAFALALLVAVVVGSIAQTQFNLGDLQRLGVDIPWDVRAQTTWRDFYGFGPLYGLIISVGLLPAFIVAGALARGREARRLPWYLLGGGLGVWAALASANVLAGIVVLVFATRHAGGLACLIAGGVLAGWTYVVLTRHRRI